MKYLAYTRLGQRSYGILLGEELVLDIPRGAAEQNLVIGETLEDLIRGGESDTVERLHARFRSEDESERDRSLARGTVLPLDDVVLAPPIAHPSKIIGIGLNYADHCREQKLPPPESPVLFAKLPSSIIGPGEAIRWDPQFSSRVDYEAELAVIIGRRARQVSEAWALDYVFGYTALNDVSARDVQFRDTQWVRGKSFDTFCPLGPWIAGRDEIPDPGQLAIRCLLNGVTMQDSRTSEMVFSVAELIAFISRAITLEPGDIIATGTPGGVGVFRKPPVFLKSGDEVVVEIEGIGKLRNRVTAP